MTGSWRWNAGFGIGGFLLIFLFSLSNNPLGTTLIRGVYAFIIFWMLAYVLRFVLGQMIGPGAGTEAERALEENKGAVLDMSTPDEDGELSDMMRNQWAGGKADPAAGFQPLKPQKFVSQKDRSTEEVVQAVRSLTDE